MEPESPTITRTFPRTATAMDTALRGSPTIGYNELVARTQPELDGLTPATCTMWITGGANGYSLVVLRHAAGQRPDVGDTLNNNDLFIYDVRHPTFTMGQRLVMGRIYGDHG